MSSASTRASSDEQVLTQFRSLAEKPRASAIVVATIRGDRTSISTYAHPGADELTSQSILEIGSITKTVTALVLAGMVDAGVVSLQDPVSRFMITAPTSGREMTLLDLATHTARLPGIPRDLWAKVLNSRENPYADYTIEQVRAALPRIKVKSGIGEKVHYSNLGFGILGQILGQIAGLSYEDLIRKHVCDPLDMTETMIDLTPELQPRKAQGHKAANKPTSQWDLPAFAGAGAIRSTVVDMTKYIRAHLHPERHPDMKGLRAVQEARVALPKGLTTLWFAGRHGSMSVGLSWMILHKEGRKIVWHNGGTGGFASFAGFIPEEDIGIVCLANSAIHSPITKTGLAALQQM